MTAVSCGFCALIEDGVLPETSDKFRLICTVGGRVELHREGKKIYISENCAAIIENDGKTDINAEQGRAYILDFSGDGIKYLFKEIRLEMYMVYKVDEEFIRIFEKLAEEHSMDVEFCKNYMVTSLVYQLFSTLARRIQNVLIPGNYVGMEGFSIKNIGTRHAGMYHGKKCIMITPNTTADGIVVLENYGLVQCGINLKEYKYMQIGYYYESRDIRHFNITLRVLNFVPENSTEYVSVYGKEFAGINEFCEPVHRNRWEYATFFLDYKNEKIRSIIDSYEKPILRQIKINPFGSVNASELLPDDKMYISFVGFYKNAPTHSGHLDSRTLEYVIKLMAEHFAEDRDISFYADACYLSTSRFSHWFKQQTGVSPGRYITDMRIERAKIYLRDNGFAYIEQISVAVGFSDVHYFSRIFKKYVGITPKQFRMEENKKAAEAALRKL